MKPILTAVSSLICLLISISSLSAQCGVGIQENNFACVDVGPYGITNSYTSWITNGPQFQYTWSVPANAQIVSGQGTPHIEVRWLSQGQGSVSLDIYDPATGCFDFNTLTTGAGGGNASSSPIAGPDTVVAGDTIQYTNAWFFGPGFGVTYNGYYTHNANQVSYIANQVPAANHTSFDTLELSWDAAESSGVIAFDHQHFSTGCITYSEKHIVLLGGMDGPADVCTGDTVQYEILNGVTVNTWTVNGGTIISGQGTSTLTVAWPTTGTGTVSCNWSYPNYGAQTSTVTVNATTPTPPAINGMDTLCNSFNGLFNYFVTNQPGHTYSWSCTNASFDNGINTGNFVRIRPDTSSTLLLQVTDSLGTCAVTNQMNIVNEAPLSDIIGPDKACESTFASYKIERNFPGATYNWTVSNGSIVTGQGTDSVYVQWTSPGNGLLQSTVNWNGCTGTLRDTVGVYGTPVVSLGNDVEICPGATINTQVSDLFYSFNAAYFNSDGQNVPFVTLDSVGDYWLDKTIFHTNLACTARDSLTVSYVAGSVIDLGPDTIVCSGSPYLLEVGTGFFNYSWSTAASTQSISVAVSGTYSVTATSVVGNCTVSDTVVVTIGSPATINLGPDQMICPDTSTVLDAGPGFVSYLWSDNSTAQTLTASAAGLYWVEVTNASGCTARDSIQISIIPDCVFPGDANHDGVVDNTDLLDIGVAFGSTGPLRPMATQGWYGQPAPNWSLSFPSTVNYKHADSDGNGIVNDDDTLAVTNNYLLTHNKTSGASGGGVPLRLVAQQPISYWGDTLIVDVVLGDANDPLVNGYGLAFTTQVQANSTVPGGFTVEYPPSFLGTKGVDMLTLWQSEPQPGQHDHALVRNNQLNVNGFGTIATLYIVPDSNLFAGQDSGTFQIDLLNPYLIDYNMQPLDISVSGSTVTVLNPALALTSPIHINLEIIPNPADQSSKVFFYASDGQPVTLQVLDLRGKILIESEMMGNGRRQTWPLATSSLSEGLYLVRIGQEGFYSGKKLMIQR